MVYMDLGMSSMQVDARERGFSYSYDAPLDMRMDTRQQLSAADSSTSGRSRAWLRRCAASARSATPAGSPARSPAAARSRRLPSWSTRSKPDAGLGPLRWWSSGQANLPGDPDRRQRRARLDRRRAATAWEMLPLGGRFAAISFHSLEDRRVKRFLAERARGCVCPPELPVCVCGREPEAELLTRRAVAPGPEEIATNPRSKSAHLRARRRSPRRPRRGPDGRRRDRSPGCRSGASAQLAKPRRGKNRQVAAPARKAPARKPPARPQAPARRPGGQLIPIAAGAATAVRRLPDSGLMVRMTRGRVWIGVLGVLLAGIVAINVATLTSSEYFGPASRLRVSTSASSQIDCPLRLSAHSRSTSLFWAARVRFRTRWACRDSSA